MRSEDTTADVQRYGCGVFRPAWLQRLNSIVGAVTFITIANLLLNVTEGLLGVVITTMERRFDLSSSQSSWMASGYEFGAVPTLVLVSLFGTR